MDAGCLGHAVWLHGEYPRCILRCTHPAGHTHLEEWPQCMHVLDACACMAVGAQFSKPSGHLHRGRWHRHAARRAQLHRAQMRSCRLCMIYLLGVCSWWRAGTPCFARTCTRTELFASGPTQHDSMVSRHEQAQLECS